jgi:GGDEF domain-containing protein
VQQNSRAVEEISPQTVYLARLGGDEFACVGFAPVPRQIRPLVMIEVVSQPISIGEQVRITISAGIATNADKWARWQGLDASNLLHLSDIAMYLKKSRAGTAISGSRRRWARTLRDIRNRWKQEFARA